MIYTISHNNETVRTRDLPPNYTLAQIQEQAATLWPEVANATPRLNGDVVTFELSRGSKA